MKPREDSSFDGLDRSEHRKPLPKRNRTPNLISMSEAFR